MDVAVVTVGDELLAGDTENTNATWLGRELADRGVAVVRVLTVPDDVEAIAENVRRYADRFDAVVVTGGLGGTPDDVTMDGVAAAFDRPLEENALARADLERTLAAIADDYPDLEVDVEAEASIPAGARPLINDAGLSPGCVVEPDDRGAVYVFPGIPGEMKELFRGVADEFAGELASAFLYTDEPEANLIERLDEARRRFDVTVGCYPDQSAGHNRLKVRGTDGAAVEAAADWLADEVRTVDP
ncbi:competence/damage-inducible protein A [Halorarius halobius]|uniref:competence/damage-inducible protein A n=1 Tax=Halorarius halobius TaxID=2962671 RepID=UPI0020CCEEA5|nr:molybdopterin-binding protein [Halorarius halobius]